MLDQSFSLKNFKRLISHRDFGKYDFGTKEAEINEFDLILLIIQSRFE